MGLSEVGQDGSLLKSWLLTDLAEARRLLESAEPSLERAIHQARRRLKRVRTLFQVVKSVAGTGHAARAEPVKTAFQRLSGPRDADAMLAAATWIADKGGEKPAAAARRLVSRLQARARFLHEQDVPVAEIAHLLRIAEAEAAALAETLDARDLLRRHLVKTYVRGRKLYRTARDERDTDDEALHEWRKQVKHRMHIGQIIEGSGLADWSFPVKALDHLAECLGEEHDFANLAMWIAHEPALQSEPGDLATLTAAISRRREKLAVRALELGSELYAEKRVQFAKTLR